MLKSYIAFDVETTGLNPEENEIIEIGALKVRGGKVQERFMEFIRPEEMISSAITRLTGITNEMVENARGRGEVISEFLEFCGDDILIGHNVIFDYSFVKVSALAEGLFFERAGIDTLKIARKVHKDMESKSLGNLCNYYNIENNAAHRAYHDALATAKLYQTLSHYFEEKEPKLFQPVQLNYKQKKVVPASQKQIEFLKRLMRNHGLEVTWSPETITKNEASKLIDNILNGGK
ncbi:PolC-type DNA polymerase III [Faecalicatena contorta]|uniref:DNA polymerase-3 subunit alpha n=1 Tax=Faecalicatena contorta TaxID=39482 RepID=A0A315ZTY3_9FIRM|nr:3'-5' exonuclease [Faecalicatena contorta]PWJ49005.1 DNA polymerase-3 subunit alpha (Gram-positive type) [Faecalicatena contorta]SUQ15095.1 DNA polymerase-3 subunit alpha [Faecalicatena contorta]